MPSRLKNGRKLVGVKQTRKAIADGRALAAYLAEDADPMVVRPIEELCAETGCELVRVGGMRELGRACGIEVSAAAAVLLK